MRIDDGRLMANFMSQALTDKPITIYGDGTQTRSLIYVDDLVEGIVRMMNKEDFIGPVNLGNPEEHTVKEIAEMIVQLVGSKSAILHQQIPQDDPTKRKPDITLAGEKLGWKPEIGLLEGLKRTAAYYQKQLLSR
jgi:UDP-glucuronate decarboxylase